MKRLDRRTAAAFLILEGALYLWYLSGDLRTGTPGSVPVKYGSIFLCLLFSAFWSLRGGSRLVTLALALTLGADTFLLLLDRDYPAGILLFCLVQLCYFLRLYRPCGGRSLWPLRLLLLVLALLLLERLGRLSPLNALAFFYFTNFLCNALLSLRGRGAALRLFSAGLFLFLCCDVCVALFQNPALAPPALAAFAGVGMWLFYLPAQVLITISGAPLFRSR